MSQKKAKGRDAAETRSADQLQDFAARGAAAQAAVDALGAGAPLPPAEIQRFALEQLAECPWNPRTAYDATKLEELAASIRESGVLQPLLVRPRPDGSKASEPFEIVFGHRRFRAARLAGVETVPVQVQEIDDARALALQVVENVQRAELSPLEEAKAYRRMIDEHGHSAEAVGALVGISRSSVYERLRLLELSKDAREAVSSGKLSASTAGVLLRIADPKARAEATQRVLAGEGSDAVPHRRGKRAETDPLSFRAARELVRDEFLLELKGAPWALDDAELVPKAGACSVCPKRSGNMPDAAEALGEVRPDVCSDSGCFKSKLEAAWNRRRAQHEEAGGKVIPDSKAKTLFPYQGNRIAHGSGFVDLDDKPFTGGNHGRKSWRQLLKGEELPVTLARNPSGRIFELVREDAAEKAIAPKGKDGKPKRVAVDPGLARERKKAALEGAKRTRILSAFVNLPTSEWPKTPKAGVDIARALAAALEQSERSDALDELLKVEPKPAKGEKRDRWKLREALSKKVRAEILSPSSNECVRRGLALALAGALAREKYVSGEGPGTVVELVLNVAGLKRDRLEALAVSEKKAREPKAKPSDATKVAELERKLAAKGGRKAGRRS